MARKSRRTQRLRVVNPDCAGIDIGKDRHFVAVDPERTEEPVRSFGAFTRDLGGDGGVAGVVWGDQGGDGIDLGLLDTGLRDAGARGLRGDARAAAHDEADRRAQERRVGPASGSGS